MPDTQPEFTFASLFSGCGGFDLGFAQAGFYCTAAFDVDPLAVEHHAKNLGSPASVCDLAVSSPILRGNRLDVLVAGPPCQGFSLAGKRKADDPRNALLVRAAHIAAQIRPKVFIVENVVGVRAGAHAKYWNALHEIMGFEGYQTREFLLVGTDWGVPQMRKRCLFLAWRTPRTLRAEIHGSPGGVLRHVLKDVRGVDSHTPVFLKPRSRIHAIARRIGPGQKLCNVRGGPHSVHTWQIPEVFGLTTKQERNVLSTLVKLRRTHRRRTTGDADPVPLRLLRSELGNSVDKLLLSLASKGFVRKIDSAFDLANTFNGKFRRLEFDRPSLTVDTRFGDPRYFLHPHEDRGFTVREAARIQGFPDSFSFFGDLKAQYRLIGNAVPPPMARSIAEIVRASLLG
jgi:DNA (cytosine-5)-methyltransferase 1